ncbi:MAG: AAA family ATPase, partial [Chloroflexota bacterium]|nr:AAA family ATPase [Chloroflexota bacterium]
MQKLPIGESSFENMRTRDYLYVDKTEYVHRMVTEGAYYFMARPRRFGKSLLLSTLKCLFQGRRELFEGLWIAEHGEWAWEEHPVVVIDFNGIPAATPEKLDRSISTHLTKVAKRYNISLEPDYIELQFQELVLALYRKTRMPVAVLIDEYDKPLIEHLGRGEKGLEIAKANRDILKGFFGVLKEASVVPALRFVFLTGVSRFSKVSIFSELNNLHDISMSKQYADMLGYTQEELEICFEGRIEQLAGEIGWSQDQVKEKLAQQYDGYRFSERDVKVYNPFSILNAFGDRAFGNYWFRTGTPTFLVNLLEEKQYDLPKIEDLQVSRSLFTAFEVDRLRPEALLFQTGYLTIKDVDGRLYTLSYPNLEVKTAFTESLLFSWARSAEEEISSHVLWLSRYLRDENLDSFFEAMTAIFASIPYDIETKRDEAYFHTIFYLMMAASGGEAQSSVLTSRGRIDMVVTFTDKAAGASKVYIIEFKCNQSAEAGIRQIHDQGYVEKYRQSGKEIILMGINF